MSDLSEATLDLPQPHDVIDRGHLGRMTLGDERLAREVLVLFDRQAANFVVRMRNAEPEAAYALAHALKGSARGIGAFAVATAAEAVEQATRANVDHAKALCVLDDTVTSARAAIARLLQSPR